MVFPNYRLIVRKNSGMICNFLKFRGESKHYFTVLYTFTPNSGFVAKFLEGKQRNFVAAMEMVEEGQNQPKNPTKRIKFEEIMEEGGEDRISALSDCFLFEILSGLPTTKDTIRTSKLSRRWKHLWTWVHTLVFTDSGHILPRSNLVSFVDNHIRYSISCNVNELNLKLQGKFLLDQIFVIRSCFTKLTLEGCVFNPFATISW